MAEPIDNRLSSLRYEFQPTARSIRLIARDFLGLDMRITETLRSRARQAELQHAGSSDVALGWHNVGLAFDFLCFDAQGRVIDDGTNEAYRKVGLIAQAFGCRYPIVRANGEPDYDHVQMGYDGTLQDWLAAHPEALPIET